MIFSVTWIPSAIQELAHLWNTAADRNAVAKAADKIDVLLRKDPQTVGESRAGTRRVVGEPPLVVFFNVLEEDRMVQVLKVVRM